MYIDILIHSAYYFHLLIDVTSALARNMKTGALRLSPDKVCFVLSEKGPLAMNLWCELTQVFTYVIVYMYVCMNEYECVG